MAEFVFQQFGLDHSQSSMKIGTDAILLGAFADVVSAQHILEVGCGSGIVSLMLAQRSEAMITAIDIHEPSVRQSLENFKQSKWADRMKAFHTPLQTLVANRKFDHIISNPPFFSNSLKSPKENRNLARHNDTLLPEEMATNVKRLLADDGVFTCIIPFEDLERYRNAFAVTQLYPEEIIHIKPKPGRETNRVIVSFSFEKKEIVSKMFTVRDENNEYSSEYRQLTHEFHP